MQNLRSTCCILTIAVWCGDKQELWYNKWPFDVKLMLYNLTKSSAARPVSVSVQTTCLRSTRWVPMKETCAAVYLSFIWLWELTEGRGKIPPISNSRDSLCTWGLMTDLRGPDEFKASDERGVKESQIRTEIALECLINLQDARQEKRLFKTIWTFLVFVAVCTKH